MQTNEKSAREELSCSPPVVLHEGGNLRVVSFGNGAAYAFDNTFCGRGVFFQGDDADTFRDELTAAYTGHPDWPVERTLRFLWGELDYGLASQPWDDGRDPTL